MSPTKTDSLPKLEDFQLRFATACDLKQTVDREKITDALTRWLAGVTKEKLPVKFVTSYDEAKKYGRDARAARAAWDASWDLSWNAISAVGALARADKATFTTWLPMLEALEAGAWIIWITKSELVVAERPTHVLMDDQRRLHCENGPAFSWLSDLRDYYWHGVNVSEDVIMHPEKITLAMIEKETNSEVRRVLITRYGMRRWLLDSKTEPIHTDKTGTLYRRAVKDSEPIVMVRVINSTKEKGIGYREFFMPVDPTLRPLPPGRWSAEKKREWLNKQQAQELTAHNAVASTWGMRGEDYHPACQT